MQRGRQVRNIQTLPILAIEVDCKRKKSDHRRCARHNGRVREDPGRQQACWGSLFCTNLTQPTGALDSKSSRYLLESMKEMNEGLAATILMVTHDAFTASYASRVIFIKDGKIFNEIRRGDDTRKQFFNRIIEVVTVLGGSLNDAL